MHEQKQCRQCNKATPWISNTKGYRDYCNNECRLLHDRKIRKEKAITDIEEFGFDYLGGYMYNKAPIQVRNRKCGHEFIVKQAQNLFTNPDYCPTCGNDIKYKKLVARNIAGAKDWKYKESFAEYRKQVNLLTARTYRENKALVNPKNLPIGRIGHSSDPHHIDHVVSVKYCYEAGIEPERCASIENLRVIEALDNMQKYSKLTEESRSILEGWN